MAASARVIVIRHGIAEAADAAARAGIADAGRALTERGRGRLRQAVAGLGTFEPRLAAIGHSPLRRARETAELVAAGWPGVTTAELPALAPGGDAAAVLAWVAEQRGEAPVAIVGHQPDLGEWIGRAVCAAAAPAFPLRKAGMASVAFPGGVRFGAGVLEWLLLPKLLRRLAPPGH